MADTSKEIRMYRGEVSVVKHHSVETGFTVFTIHLESDGKLTRNTMSCAGVTDDPPVAGSMVEVYGYQNMTQWGPQVKFTAFHILAGQNASTVARYLISFAKYLGNDKAMAIAKHFGGDIERILDKEPDRLLEVEGIGPVIKDNIVSGWLRDRSLHSVKIFLSSIGLSDFRIRQIVARHGPHYDSKLKEDPYVLMHEGLGFSVCDGIATKLNIDPTSVIRVRALILEAIRSSTIRGEGHLYMTREALLRFVNDQNNSFPSSRKIDEEGVSWDILKPGIENLLENGHIFSDVPDCFYLMPQFFYEARSAELLSLIIASPGEEKFLKLNPLELVKKYEAHERINIPEFSFSEKQIHAIESFIKDKVMIVTGPPGTGKTTVIKTFVRILEDCNVSYCLLAPTGAAAKRLEQTSNKTASTIHRFLGYQGDAWKNNSNSKIDESVVIVDECSMVDMELFFRLVSSCRENAHLIFVGDADQLPSVGPGNVLKSMIQSGKVPKIMLDQVHRQAALSEIVLEANRIREGNTDMTLFREDIKADICFVKTGRDVLAAEKAIAQICKSLQANPKVSYQVLTPRNEGDLSVASLNQLLQRALNPPGTTPVLGSVAQLSLDKETVLRPGDRAIVIKNNYSLGVFNGDIGTVRLITSEIVRLDLLSGESVAIPISSAREMLKLAFATTIHKAQGSEYGVVVMPLIKSHGSMLLQRNLLYTALTRARKKVVVVGSEAAIESAITNASIKDRNTLFANRLQECLTDLIPDTLKFTRPLFEIKSTAENFNRVQRLLNPAVKENSYAYEDPSDLVD